MRLEAFLAAHFISIHALLAESDEQREFELRKSAQFLSTLSLRRATAGSRVNAWWA